MRLGAERRVVPAVLLGLTLLIVSARLHTFDEPFETDITGAAVIGQELLHGRHLYAEVWDHKPPALHVTHALAILVVGFGPAAIYALGVAAAVATLLGVYAAGAALGSAGAGLWAAAGWAVISGDLWNQGNQPNAEVFVNACLVWAFALLARAGAAAGPGRILVVGTLLALGSLYKQVIVAPAAALALAHLACPPPGRSRGRALLDVALLAAVGLLAWLAVLVYFAAVGRLEAFWGAVVTYNRFYTERVPTQVLKALGPSQLAIPFIASTVSLAVLAALAVPAALLAGLRRAGALLLALIAATPVAIGLHGQFVPHYYQLWLPALVIGSGWAVAATGRLLDGRRPWVPHAVGAAGLVVLVAQQLPLYGLPAEDWSLIKYGPIFVEERRLARELDALLAPGETFYEWGSEVGLYFWSRRPLPSGAFQVWPVVAGPEAGRLSRRLLADLQRAQPEVWVRAKWTEVYIKGRHPVLEWLGANYRPLPGQDPGASFTLHVRRGGALERRLGHAAR